MEKLMHDLVPFVAAFVVCFIGSSFSAEVDDGENTLMAYAASRAAISKIVVEGKLLGIDEKAAPYRMMAQFQIIQVFKGTFGEANDKPPNTIWIASQVPNYRYDCLKELTKSTNYFVYLNGTYSRLWMSVNETNKQAPNVTSSVTRTTDVFQQKVRKIYWISALPQKVHQKRLREVQRYSCSDCSRKPEVSLSYGNKSGNGSWSVSLSCKLLGECRLASLFRWFKDGHPIDENEQNQSLIFISGRKYSSTLLIKKFSNQYHRGKYHCRVINVLGRKDSKVESLPRVSKPPTTETTSRATTTMGGGGSELYRDWIRCDNSLCNFRGKCFKSPKTNDFACTCSKGYHGETCELDYWKDETVWGILDKSAGLNVFLIVGVCIILLVLVALVVIICCFSKLKNDVQKMQTSPHISESSRSPYVGRDRVDAGLQKNQSADVKKDLPSSQSRIGNNSNDFKSDFVDLSAPPSSPRKTREHKNTQPSPIFSTLRRNYEPLEGRGKVDKSIKMSPLFGKAGSSYRPLSPPKSGNGSSSFTHYVIGPPEGHGSLPTSDPSASLGRAEERPLKSRSAGDEVDPKLEEELKGILKELGEYVNDNQRLSQASDLKRPEL